MDVLWFTARALRKDPGDRYADASAMLDELNRVRSGMAAPRCHVTKAKSSLAKTDRWIDRHPNAFTVISALLALGLLGGVGAGIGWLLS